MFFFNAVTYEWYVSKHGSVNHYVHCIEQSLDRLSIEPAAGAPSAALQLSDEDVLLDPRGNVPLKIFTAARGDIPLLTTAGWTPPLRLSARQQEVLGAADTVLLLGRSGTGKTVCLCDRMSRDRESARVASGKSSSLRQLFISRSRRLCEFVRSYQLRHGACQAEVLQGADFVTLDGFVLHMEGVVSRHRGGQANRFHSASGRVDFRRFASHMSADIKKSGLDAVVLWTQIRSFITSSIEAVIQ